MSILRPYQSDAILRVKKSMVAGHKRVCLVLPTGTGKTVVGTSMVQGAVAKGSRVLWLAHRTELVDQAWKTMHRAGIAAGAIGASVRSPINPNALVQVASIDTLIARDKVPPADIVFFDEAHHVEAATWNEFLRKNYPSAYVIGLTATPERGDGKPLALFDDLVLGVSIAEAVKLGALVHAEIVRPNARQGKGKIAKRPVDAYLQFANGEQCISFTNLVEAAEQHAKEFNDAGVPASCIHGNMSAAERGETLDKFKDGRIKVITNVGILTEGFDCLDQFTEILTTRGWLGIGQVRVGDTIEGWNHEKGIIEEAVVTNCVDRVVRDDEKMLTIKSQHMDIRTTENHRFYIKYRDPGKGGALSDNTLVVSGERLSKRKSSYALPLSAEKNFPGIPLSDDEIRFVAWFMTDGGFEGGEVAISQSKDMKHEIRALLLRLGLDFRERVRANDRGYPNSKPITIFNVPKGTDHGSKARNGYVKKYLKYLSKDVSPLLHAMTRNQFLVFWEEMLKGDGSNYSNKNKTDWLWCDRKSQIDTYSAMAVTRGLSVSYAPLITRNGTLVYRISIRDKQWITSDPSDERSAITKLEAAKLNERVWCVSTSLGTLITRRRGKVVILGNCPEASCVILARSVGSMGLYLQMVGRVLRTYPGKNKATILDLHGVSHTFGHPEDEMEYHLDGEHGIVLKKEPVQKDRLCKVCSGPLEEDGFCVDCGMEWKPEGPTVTDAELKYAAMRAQPQDKFQSTLFKWAKEGRAKGYKPGWLFYKIKSVYGKEHPWSECARLMNERDPDHASDPNSGVQDTASGGLSQ